MTKQYPPQSVQSYVSASQQAQRKHVRAAGDPVQSLTLSHRDMHTFFAAADNTTPPSQAFKDALRTYRQQRP